MATETQTYSRFSQTEPILFDGCETYGRWNNPLSSAIYDSLIVVVVDARYAGRPDIIADVLYGDSSLDWALIAVNNVTETLNWPSAGSTIKAPNPSVMTGELL